ncbi:MAG: CRTAC1 family protein [Saprospiraceae bacterium]|nr:CRTAC1 family protein [Saprospiraceae bacterium]
MKYFFLLFFFCLFQQHYGYGQEISDFQPVIGQIGQLESNKDPKCHATASRLEDFLFGTPLSFEARDKRIAFQKNYVKTLWLDYTRTVNSRSGDVDQLAIFKEIEQKYFSYNEDELGIQLSFPDQHKVFIAARDFRQYSTVAYALRAILSVQQSFLFESETLAPLNDEVMTYFKKSIDLSVIALLKESDKLARRDNEFQIGEDHINAAAKLLFNNLKSRPSTSVTKKKESIDYRALVYTIIDQKQAAYRNYNKINQSVFLRNIQVYFSRILWPKDPKVSKELTNFYTNLMVQFSTNLLDYAELLALQQNKPTMEYDAVYHAVQAYLPHSINMFEDVTYFPNLDMQNQIVIEAYDLDAFRDSGLHWQYLKYALDDRETDLKVALDPFALELIVEGIAQFAVLVFRMGGTNAKEQGQDVMEIQHIKNALLNFQNKLDENQKMPATTSDTKIISGKSVPSLNTETPFTEISNEVALNFEHRNSDWLNRTIRAYVVKEDENLARLAIPPAFGGSGVAAEDMDNDGWIDILLLGGRGNRLLKNDKGKQFVDVTDHAGLNWKRPDGNYGEPRQPILVDFDNDGWQDIFISFANDAHRIYRNRGDGTFEDMTEQANLGGEGLIGGPATSIDYDKDGLADIYIGYFGNYLEGELPTLKRHNTNGSPNKLLRNMGNFRFEDVSEGSGLQNLGWTQAVGHADINGDSWQDLVVGNDFGINAYYLNNQDGTFTDASASMATDKPSYTMNIGISDLNRDMRPDFYISNIVVMEKDDKYVLPNEDTPAHFDPSSLATMRVVEANDLFISATDMNGSQSYAKSTAIGRGYSATGWSWDADFFDFDNDGDDDLYCLTGMNQYSVYGSSNEYYNSPDGEAKEVTYANSNEEANILFTNVQGTLEVTANSGGLDYSGTSRSAAFFDMDNDGDLEVIVNDYQNKAKLFRNNTKKEGNTTNWVAIKLVGDPSQKITKDAIGTALILTTPDGEKKWKEVYSTTGYLSVHPKICHFGLGAAKACNLEIRWPNGHVQIIENLEINKQHIINYK